MDFGTEHASEPQRVFGHSENICLEKSVIRNGDKSVNPCHIGPVVRRVGNKKPQLITVGVFYLVEAAGIEPASACPLPAALHA
jgi:hypothetical protein